LLEEVWLWHRLLLFAQGVSLLDLRFMLGERVFEVLVVVVVGAEKVEEVV